MAPSENVAGGSRMEQARIQPLQLTTPQGRFSRRASLPNTWRPRNTVAVGALQGVPPRRRTWRIPNFSFWCRRRGL